MTHQLPSQQIAMGHYQPANETPIKWRFAGGPILARFYMPTWS